MLTLLDLFFAKRDVSISPKILVMRLANYIKNDALFHYVIFFFA